MKFLLQNDILQKLELDRQNFQNKSNRMRVKIESQHSDLLYKITKTQPRACKSDRINDVEKASVELERGQQNTKCQSDKLYS